MNVQEIRARIKEVQGWEPCTERDMSLTALGSMLISRAGQVQYQDKIWVNKNQLVTPSVGFWDRIFSVPVWLEYDDLRFFDCARRIDLRSGTTESTPMKRHYGYDPCFRDLLDLPDLLRFIKLWEGSQ